MQDLSRFVPNVHFEQIPIKNLVSNQEYQRPLSQAQVEKAIEDFDLNQINPVKVSRRDGINYVFNGQHTIEIVATVSGSRETPVWCMIYDSLDYQNEADIFANQMKHVRPLKPYEIFMANIEAGNEQQLVIKRLVESYSLSIGPAKAYGVICAVATLERIYTKYGYHVLDRTLRLCVGTWEGDIDSLGGIYWRVLQKWLWHSVISFAMRPSRKRLDSCLFVSYLVLRKSVEQALSAMPKPCSLLITANADTPCE